MQDACTPAYRADAPVPRTGRAGAPHAYKRDATRDAGRVGSALLEPSALSVMHSSVMLSSEWPAQMWWKLSSLGTRASRAVGEATAACSAWILVDSIGDLALPVVATLGRIAQQLAHAVAGAPVRM